MDTKGWDTAFLCAMSKINDNLAAHGSELITEFDYSEDGIEITGSFGPWRLVTGGSSKVLRFQLPITAGKIDAPGLRYPLDGIVPEVDLQLSFLDSDGDVRPLVFDCRVPGRAAGDTTPGAVTMINPDTTGTIAATSPAWGIVHDLLPKVVIENREQLRHVFARVNLVPPESGGWLAPVKFDYVYHEPVGGDAGYLGVLTVVSDRDITGLQRVVDPALAGDGSDPLCFGISQTLFLDKVVRPALPAAFGHGAMEANFVMSAGGIVNNGKLDAGGKEVGLVWYYPKITSLRVEVADNALRVTSDGSFDITGLTDAYVTFTTSARNEAHFDPDRRTLSFLADPNPHKDYTKHVPTWEYIIGIIGGPIILAIVDIVVDIVTDNVSSSVSESVNTANGVLLSTIASDVVEWPGLSTFDVRDAGLSGALYLRGKFVTQ